MIIHATIPFGQYSAKKAGGSRGEAGKTMRRRQIGLRARNKLAQLSPNSRGILANVARLPGSSNFSSILLPFFFSSFVSLAPFPSTIFFLRCSSSSKSTSTLWSFQRTRANNHWKNHESVSLNPILTELERRSRGNGRRFVHARRRLLEKSFAEHARASTRRSLFVHAADWSLFLMFRDFYQSLFMSLSSSFVLLIFLFL